MPYFNATLADISSGAAGTSTQLIERIQSVSIGYSVPRVRIGVPGRFSPLSQMPVLNYTPASFQIEHIKSSSIIESNLGLLNSTGVGVVFANGDPSVIAGYGARNIDLYIAPPNSQTYQGQLSLLTGVLTSYAVSASVSEPARCSFGGEALDMQIVPNTSNTTVPNYAANIVKPENVSISGIAFSGFGVTGITIQNFSLTLDFARQSIFTLGSKYPKRAVTAINAKIGINGLLEGLSQNFTGLSTYDCGNVYTGTLYFTLQPSCTTGPGTTYAVQNPYLETFRLSNQVGSFVQVEMTFDLPISINPISETGSNLIIS